METDTDAKTLAQAHKYQALLRRRMERYYKNADEVLAKNKAKRLAENPNLVPRPNRKRRGMSEATGSSSSWGDLYGK
jgi:hypothetical protein